MNFEFEVVCIISAPKGNNHEKEKGAANLMWDKNRVGNQRCHFCAMSLIIGIKMCFGQ